MPQSLQIVFHGINRSPAFTIRIDLMASGQELIVNRTNMDVMAALNEAFDTVRRSVKEEAEKRRNH